MQESYKINIIRNKHIFEVLDTKSQTIIFTQILRVSEEGVFNNTISNRKKLLDSLKEADKSISSSRFLAILKEVTDKGMLVRIGKGKYKINKEYIEKL